jgi:hypothetical protein
MQCALRVLLDDAPARFLAGLLAFACAIAPALADTLILKSGEKFDGEIQDKGDAFEVKTKYGLVTVRKEEVSKVVRPAALTAEAESLRRAAGSLLEEAQKPEVKPDECRAKLAVAEEKLNKALALYRETRSVSAVDAAATLDTAIAGVTQVLALCREKQSALARVSVPSLPPAELAPPNPPPAAGVAQPVIKRPAPDGPAIAEAERQIREIFKDEYPKKGAADRAALARRLLEAGGESRDADPLQFVALREARELAAGAGDLETAFEAIDRIDKYFRVDASALKAAAFLTATKAIHSPETAERVFSAGLDLLDRLACDSEYDEAVLLLPALGELARRLRNADHVKTVQSRATEVRSQQAEWVRVRPLIEKLKEKPNDAETCLAVAKYHMTAKSNWEAALPLLARCGQPGLVEAAMKDIAQPTDAAGRAGLGDLWWALSEKELSPFKAALQNRAKFHYEKALPELSGLAKAKAQKRIDSAAAAPGGRQAVNLLALVDKVKDTVLGTWKSDGRALTSDAGPCSRIMLPYEVPAEYDFRVEFTRIGGNSTVGLMLSKGDRPFCFEIARSDEIAGFCYIDGRHVDSNPTKTKFAVVNGRRYNVKIQVRHNGLKAFVDGKPIISWQTDYKNLTQHPGWTLPNKQCLGIGSFNSPTTFHVAELIEVSGHGKRLR